MNKNNYDSIELKIEPPGTFPNLWSDYNRCIILINGKDILDIIKDAELPYYIKDSELSEESAGDYIHMTPTELYDDLITAEKSNGKEIAHVLCCTCGDTDCDSARITVLKTPDSIIWNNFITKEDWNFGLSYEFAIKQYREFLKEVKKMPLKVLK